MQILKQQKPETDQKNIIIFAIAILKQMEPAYKMKAPSGTRQISVCSNQSIFLVVVYDTVRIYSTTLQSVLINIKLDSTPRSARLSQCGKYFYIHDSNNNIFLYDTKHGMMIQQVIGAQNATKTIRFSKNSEKLIYASTQMLCLWNIRKCRIDVRTQHWKNMNCYDVSHDGNQFAIGTYNGVIYVLDFIQLGRCSQIQIKRHKTCVAAICFHENKIISASHDGYFLISTISKDSNDERMITYHEMKMKSIPKEIQSVGNNFYMFNNQGMTWFNFSNGLTLTGFTDHKIYRPYVNEEGKTMFLSLFSGEIQWWPAAAFKTMSEIQKQRALKLKQKQQQKENAQNNQDSKKDIPKLQENTNNNNKRIVYRVTYKK